MVSEQFPSWWEWQTYYWDGIFMIQQKILINYSTRKLCFFERWIRRELSNLTRLQQVTCIVQLQLIRILFSCFEIVVGEICHFLMGTLNSWIGLNSCRIIMCSGAEQVTLTIPLSAQRCNIYELQQTATVSNCLGNSSIPHCALGNYYWKFFVHSSLYRSGKSRRFNHNKFQRSQILSNGSFPCPLKGEILLQTINSHKKLKCYLTWLLIFFSFFFFLGPHTSILTLSLLLSYTFAYSIIIVSVSFLSTFISLIHKSLLSSLFIFCPPLPWFASFDLLGNTN